MFVRQKLRNITITLEETLARWARVEAARLDTSVSAFLGKMLRERMDETDTYDIARRRALARKPFLTSGGSYPSRDEIHDRDRIR